MCGISCIVAKDGIQVPKSVILEMTETISHRGPDDSGYEYFSENSSGAYSQEGENWKVGFGHRRLSIIELSKLGHQPMCYERDSWIIFNGEIYNYIELRAELIKLGYHFQTNSDTEVILAAYKAWGVDCFKSFNGMWGIVIFDLTKKQIVLSRDRLGIKPLYIFESNDCFSIASEIKQFLSVPGFKATINTGVVTEWVQTGYENFNASFFKGVKVVEPGTYQLIDLKNTSLSGPIPYWNPSATPIQMDGKDVYDIFRQKFEKSISIHLRSDVPVACALSGGLDSSSVALLMNYHNPEAFHSFSTIFPGHPLNERPYIDEVLKRINAVPHFNTPEPKDFVTYGKQFIWHNDEPPVAFSPFASFMLAKNIQQNGIKVTLNGQGGDELMGGYWQNYLAHLRSVSLNGNVGVFLKHTLGSIMPGGNPQLVHQMFIYLLRIRRKKSDVVPWIKGDQFTQSSSNFLSNYLSLEPEKRREYDLRYLILPKLLKYDDRNTMAFSVEGRYPFLDSALVDFCLQLQPEFMYRNGWTKLPLRKGLASVLPEKLVKRKSKWGYPVPQDQWVSSLNGYFTQWLKSDRPIWDIISRERVADMLARIVKGQTGSHELFVRIHMLDLWLEVFDVKYD
ncbi:MAG: asparagine synthase (glutamine-hydrolyzing) [Cyclobacteriaceae bacterium]